MTDARSNDAGCPDINIKSGAEEKYEGDPTERGIETMEKSYFATEAQ